MSKVLRTNLHGRSRQIRSRSRRQLRKILPWTYNEEISEFLLEGWKANAWHVGTFYFIQVCSPNGLIGIKWLKNHKCGLNNFLLCFTIFFMMTHHPDSGQKNIRTVRKNPAITYPVITNPAEIIPSEMNLALSESRQNWISPYLNLPKTESRLLRIPPKVKPTKIESRLARIPPLLKHV